MNDNFEWILVVFKGLAETNPKTWMKVRPYPLYLDRLGEMGNVYRWENIKTYDALVDILSQQTSKQEKLEELINKGYIVTLGDYANIFTDDTDPSQKFIKKIKEFTGALMPHWANLGEVPDEIFEEVSILVVKYSTR